jgi:hypothetical protein
LSPSIRRTGPGLRKVGLGIETVVGRHHMSVREGRDTSGNYCRLLESEVALQTLGDESVAGEPGRDASGKILLSKPSSADMSLGLIVATCLQGTREVCSQLWAAYPTEKNL